MNQIRPNQVQLAQPNLRHLIRLAGRTALRPLDAASDQDQSKYKQPQQ